MVFIHQGSQGYHLTRKIQMIQTQLEPGKIQRANPESNIKKMI